MKRHLLFVLLLLTGAMWAQTPAGHSITIIDTQNGTITAEPNENVQQGTEVTVTVEPYDFYVMQEGSLMYYFNEDSAVIEKDENGIYKFGMPDADIAITATFEKKKHNISIDGSIEHGIVELDPSGQVEVGAEINVTATPDDEAEFKLDSVFYIRPNNITVKIEHNLFTMPDEDVTVSASFSERKHKIETISGDHGTVSVDPTQAEEGETVRITIEPEPRYVLSSLRAYYKTSWFYQHDLDVIAEADHWYFIMPDHDVWVEAEFGRDPKPFIDDIDAIDPVCAGYPINLPTPTVWNGSSETAWQFAPDTATVAHVNTYNNEPLSKDYDGWWLRFWAKNEHGEAFSNWLAITVWGFDDLTLTGDVDLFVGEIGAYEATFADYARYEWSCTDPSANMVDQGTTCQVAWATGGMQQLSVVVTDTITLCTDTLSLTVTVRSCVAEEEADKELIAKKKDDKEYLLIFPNKHQFPYHYQWYNADEPLEGDTLQYYYKNGGIPDGKYKVRIDFGEGSDCYAFSQEYVVGSGGNDSGERCFFPNPLPQGGRLTFVNDTDAEIQLSIYTLNGRLLHRQTLTGIRPTVDATLPQGVYVAYLIDASGNLKVEKIIVQ